MKAKTRAPKLKGKRNKSQLNGIFYLSFLVVCLIFSAACRKPAPTDMRSFAPAETLVYLEIKDLGDTLEYLAQNKSFQELAKSKLDFSAVESVQTALVVTGFETSEKPTTNESSILNFKPQFALIADTHSWESTNLSLVENQIGQFARKTYGDDLKFEKREQSSVKFFVWTASDNRKLFAAVSENIVYLSNDDAVLEKCLAVKRGEAENLTKNQSLAQVREHGEDANLAYGYVSPEGIANIANIAGVSVAVDATEQDAGRSIISRILPVIVKETAREISWTARKSEQGIEDKVRIKIEPQASSVWQQTLIAGQNSNFGSAEYIPAEFDLITRYNLQNPQIAWRSLLLTLSSKLDPTSGKILTGFSGIFFAPYGIADAEIFLSSIGTELVTAQFDEEGEKSVVITDVKDEAKVKSSITKELDFNAPPEMLGSARVWTSKESLITAAFVENKLILGNRESVLKCLKAKETGGNFSKTSYFQRFSQTTSLAATIKRDYETTGKMVGVLGSPKNEAMQLTGFYTIETKLDSNGIERRTVSDFGLIGTIIQQFGKPD